MTPGRSRRGRPVGAIGPAAQLVCDLLSDRSMTAAQIAQELKLSIVATRHICSRLKASGVLEVVGRIRVPGAHRPVHVYSIARQAEGIAGLPGCFPFFGIAPT